MRTLVRLHRFCSPIALLGVLLLSTTPAAQTVKPSPSVALIPTVEVLRGEFEQVRYVRGVRAPLRSQGRFLVSRSDGVVWRTEQPLQSLILIRRSGEVVDLNAKRPAARKPPRTQAAMSRIMLALLAGDEATLTKHFSVQRSGSDGAWTLTLTPKGAMSRMFSVIEMRGGRHLRTVRMQERSGDATELEFRVRSEQPASLSAEEAGYFR